MKALTLVVFGALAAAAAASAHAQKDWRAPSVVTRVCSGCHGIDGNSSWPIVPNLAAQNAGYIEGQLGAFRAAAVPSSIEVPEWLVKSPPAPATARTGWAARTFMIGSAHQLQPDEIKAAADWYARQKPVPGRVSDAALVAQGRALFEKGAPGAGVPPCSACHGADGAGMATFPRIAGQHAAYTTTQLQGFVNGDRPAGSPMHGIAKDLTADEIRAVAAYLQSL